MSNREKQSLHILTEKRAGGWGKKKKKEFLLSDFSLVTTKYFLDSTSASKGFYGRSCSDTVGTPN